MDQTVTDTRQRIGPQILAHRIKRNISLEVAAARARLTMEQAHSVECGLGLFRTAKQYAAGLGLKITAVNFYRQKNVTAKLMAALAEISEPTAAKAIRCAFSPVSGDDDGLDVNALEAVVFNWHPRAYLVLT